MPGSDDFWGALETYAATDQGRGSEALATGAHGDLRSAVQSLIAATPAKVVIVTGFAIPTGKDEWSAETDGPLGAVQLSAALTMLGWDARILTDATCAVPIRALVADSVPLDVAPTHSVGGHACPELIAQYRDLEITHVISIERVGPSPDGRPRNMRGEDIGYSTACLHHVVEGGPWYSVGIGDGGNEIGMGRLPAVLVENSVPLGERVRCVVGTDAVIVAGTSNWGAAALVAALAIALARPDILAILQNAHGHELLSRLVRAGAVDGVSRQPTDTIDGLEWRQYQRIVDMLIQVARQEDGKR